MGSAKAAVNYTGSAEGLKLTVNAGNTIDLISGPSDFDALSRLGIAAGVLSAPAANSTSTTSTATTGTTPTYGLGLSGTLNISTKTAPPIWRARNCWACCWALQTTYQTSNKPAASTATVGNTAGKASSYTTSQLATYNMALSLLGGS